MLKEYPPVKPEEACVCGRPDCPQGIMQAALLNRKPTEDELRRAAIETKRLREAKVEREKEAAALAVLEEEKKQMRKSWRQTTIWDKPKKPKRSPK